MTEYFVKDSPLPKDQIAKAPKHRMDCVDCHNRPTHIYVPPDLSVDQLAVGQTAGCFSAISQAAGGRRPHSELRDHRSGHAGHRQDDCRASTKPSIQHSVTAKNSKFAPRSTKLQRIYRTTIFPEMKVNWQTHPNNIGHFYFNGCFRCHDGQHVSADGRVITKDCQTCHSVLSQQEGGVSMAAVQKVSFQHPIDLGDLTQVNCSDCHSAGGTQ